MDEDYPPSIIPQEQVTPQPEAAQPTAIHKLGQFFWDILETVVFALAIFVIIYLFIAQPHQVQGDSMYPNFLSGEYILTNKIVYRFENPKRGDVVIFNSPFEKDFIKRIIGVPGDHIKIQGGRVYVNGTPLEEAYLPNGTDTPAESFIKEGQEVVLPPGQYATFGDNRPRSYDSRDWGFIHKSDIIGKAWIIYFPFSHFGIVPQPHYNVSGS